MATLVLVILIGTSAQILAERRRIPAARPLLLAVLSCGEAALVISKPALLGDASRTAIKASVAIVIFEGGMMLDVREIRHASPAVLGIVTVGLLITTALSGILAHYLIGW